MHIFQSGISVVLINRPFQGSTEGAKAYGGLGGCDLIRYRPNQIFDPFKLPLNGDFANDVSLATVRAPTISLGFTAPSAWWGRNDVWLQVRTFANDLENESFYRPRRISIDGSGNLVPSIVGEYLLLGVDPGDAGAVAIRFAWILSRDSIGAKLFAAVYVSGPTNPGTVTVAPQAGLIQRLPIAGLAAGSYQFQLQAQNGGVHLTLGVISFTVASVPTGSGSLSIREN
jgi:hypothetical protein